MLVLPSYRNQTIDLYRKSIDWFPYEDKTGIKWVKLNFCLLCVYKLCSQFRKKKKDSCFYKDV